MNVRYRLPDKLRVARSFGRAAANYDRFASFQRDIADRLIAGIEADDVDSVLDLGSGTGYCARLLIDRYPGAVMTNLDIAEAMLCHARAGTDKKQQHWICGDTESLPFRNDSFDLAVSSLTLQWCREPRHFFRELHRVMRPGARAWVSTLAEHTLAELRASWAQVDAHVHVNSFRTCAELESAITGVPFSHHNLANSREQVYYASLRDLARELKGIGANNLNGDQAAGLTGKNKLRKLKSAFEKNAMPGKGIPVTYDLVMITLEK